MTTNYPPRRLTEGFIRGLPHASAPYFVRDTRVVGLLVTVNKLSKSYKVQKDLWSGQRGRRRLVKTVRHTLGTVDDLCLEDARTKAEEVIAKIKKGVDPNARPGGDEDGAHIWTVERMYKEYTSDMRTRERADRTMVDILDRLDRYLRAWKPLPITEIKRSMAREEHKRISIHEKLPPILKHEREIRLLLVSDQLRGRSAQRERKDGQEGVKRPSRNLGVGAKSICTIFRILVCGHHRSDASAHYKQRRNFKLVAYVEGNQHERQRNLDVPEQAENSDAPLSPRSVSSLENSRQRRRFRLRPAGQMANLDKLPHLFFVLWDNHSSGAHRCRVWCVRPRVDPIFRAMCSRWYDNQTDGTIKSNNFQLHPPRGLDTNVFRNTCGNLSYPLLFAAERIDGRYQSTSYAPLVRDTGLCTLV